MICAWPRRVRNSQAHEETTPGSRTRTSTLDTTRRTTTSPCDQSDERILWALARSTPPISASTKGDPALLQQLDDSIPLQRMADLAEIASVVVFLSGEGASYVTATTVFADGGLMPTSPGL